MNTVMPWHVKNWKWLRWIVAILFASGMTVIAVLIYEDSAVPAAILGMSALSVGPWLGPITFNGIRKLFLRIRKRPDLIHKGVIDSNFYRQNEAIGDITCVAINGCVLLLWLDSPLEASVPTIVWFGFWSALGMYNAKLESDSSPS